MFGFFNRCKNGDCNQSAEKSKPEEPKVGEPKPIEKPWFTKSSANDILTMKKGDCTYTYDRDGHYHSYNDQPSVDCKIKNWHKNGILHREKGPAYIDGDTVKYYKHGILHREGGPAIKTPSSEEWYLHGKHHRVDGPAIVNSKGSEWLQHGEHKNSDGPVIKYRDGSYVYIQNNLMEYYRAYDGLKVSCVDGVPHNPGGPAVTYKDKEFYFIKGREVQGSYGDYDIFLNSRGHSILNNNTLYKPKNLCDYRRFIIDMYKI